MIAQKIFVFTVSVLLLALTGRALSETSPVDDAKLRMERGIKEFEQSKDPGWLVQVFEDIYQLRAPDSAPRALRTFKVNSMLRLLFVAESNIDLAFDPNKTASRNVAVPRTGSGDTPPSGVDPRNMPEGEMRRAYEAAIAANNEVRRLNNENRGLYDTKQRLLAGVAQYVAEAYPDPTLARAELMRYFTQYRIQDTSKDRILASIRPKGR